jgi:hypothetical protein
MILFTCQSFNIVLSQQMSEQVLTLFSLNKAVNFHRTSEQLPETGQRNTNQTQQLPETEKEYKPDTEQLPETEY